MDIIGRSYKLISFESFKVELSIPRTHVFGTMRSYVVASKTTTTTATATGKTKLKADCVKNTILWIHLNKTMFRKKIHLLFKVVKRIWLPFLTETKEYHFLCLICHQVEIISIISGRNICTSSAHLSDCFKTLQWI